MCGDWSIDVSLGMHQAWHQWHDDNAHEAHQNHANNNNIINGVKYLIFKHHQAPKRCCVLQHAEKIHCVVSCNVGDMVIS